MIRPADFMILLGNLLSKDGNLRKYLRLSL